MHIISNTLKSTIMAAVIFWLILYKTAENEIFLFLFFISLIPIFLSCLITILFTICPFYWFMTSEGKTNKHVFKTYFPYYAIICFISSSLVIIASDFEVFVISLCTSICITTSHSWMWFSKN